MEQLFSVGDRIYGFCNGFFGRDDYDTKICVSVTSRYAIFQYLDGDYDGNAVALNHPSRFSIDMVNEWKNPK
jgi:hypothetical protein